MRSQSLAFVLSCHMLSWVLCLGAECDKDSEYLHDRLCCEYCPPGHFVKEDCSLQKQTECAPCEPGTFSAVSDNENACKQCKTCQHDTLKICTPDHDTNCTCREDFLCTTDACNKCQKKEKCPRGQELQRSGNYEYKFKCEPCSDGKYSDIEGGACKPITRCDQLGQEKVFPGNSTHNSICRPPGGTEQKPKHDTEKILVTILLLFGFTSLVVLVRTCLWKVKYRKLFRFTVKDPQCPPMTMDLPDQTVTFQLSKEEKGDRSIFETDTKNSLTSLTCELPLNWNQVTPEPFP
ncbi:hypothetical protein AGOR_G00157440 [Albula goreensis]|uniref:TNFR-Cys domain-containing protein n=1 Tax=Albula goreensis TaxID=1534307 RepID=A0A8T3CZM3_9TELE|nr:hypothetical protein AGOR_G00157440 [Albula goreensis]